MKIILTLILSSFLFGYTTNVPKVNTQSKPIQSKSFISVPSLINYDKVVLTPKSILMTTHNFYREFKGGQELLKKATAYIVFPKVDEGGLVIGAKYGFGALVQNYAIANYYKTYSTSIGLQVGVQKYSLIVVFLTKESLNRFINKEVWKLSANGELSFITWHKGLDINTLDLRKDTIVIPFDNKGLMVGITLEGTVFQQLQLGR